MARVLLLALILPGLGFTAAALRARAVAAPVLPHEMTANVEGRVIGLDRSASERPRVLLDRVVIHGLEPGETPARVRISLDPSTPWESLQPGMRLLGQARLSPPAAPAEPGGFDFRRLAWFERLGAVGYARTPFLETAGGDASGFRQLTFRLRMALSAHIQARIPGQNGAFAAAILSGDRSAIAPEVNEELRLSTLYHIVSIGGLHMSLIAAAVFAIVRYGLALVPRLALIWPLKKIAAVASLAVTFAYLAVSGFDVAAQRAFVMLAVVLAAVMLDRPALTMRSVAVAALVDPRGGAGEPDAGRVPDVLRRDDRADRRLRGAARAGLVAGDRTRRRWRLARPVLAVFITSLVAGVATAPYSAFHFNVLGAVRAARQPAGDAGDGAGGDAGGGGGAVPRAARARLARLHGDGLGHRLRPRRRRLGRGPRRRGGRGAGRAGGEPRAAVARRALPRALERARALGRARADRGRGGALGGGRPAGRADRRQRPAVRHPHARRGGCCRRPRATASPPRAGSRTTATSPARPRRTPAAGSSGGGTGSRPRCRGSGGWSMSAAATPAAAEAECAAAAVLIAPNWERAPAGACLFVGRERLARDGALAIRITGRASRSRARGRAGGPGAAIPPRAPRPLRLAGGQPDRPGLP